MGGNIEQVTDRHEGKKLTDVRVRDRRLHEQEKMNTQLDCGNSSVSLSFPAPAAERS